MKNFTLRHFFIVFILIQSLKIYSQNLPIIGFGDQANYRIDYFNVPGSSGLDLHWYGGIRFGDSTSNSVMQIAGGNVGIGTTNPRANLDVAKDISNGQLGAVFGRLPEGDGTGLGTYLGVKGYATQGTDFGNIKSFSIVHDFYGTTNNSINFYRGGSIEGGFMSFCTSNNTEKMRIGANGYVGIGSTNPDSKLTVKGKIHAEEVKIDLAVPADYVFEKYYLGKSPLKPDYTLLTLAEVQKFTEENHHLPNVPSAKEIKENGLIVGEMSNVLLQKIEELTLYSIEQKKTIEKQAAAIEKLEKENEIMKEENNLIKKSQIELEKKIENFLNK